MQLRISTLTSASRVNCTRYDGLMVQGLNQKERLKMPAVYSSKTIPAEKRHIPSTEIVKKWPHLQQVGSCISPLMDCEVGLLIGVNCPEALAPLDVIVGPSQAPFAQRTALGWTIVGSTLANEEAIGSCLRVMSRECPVTPSQVIAALESDFRDTAVEDLEAAYSQDEARFLEVLRKEIHQKETGRLEMPLPFKNTPDLGNNREMAKQRLEQLRRKLEKNPTLKKDYQIFMESVIKEGSAEIVPADSTLPGWYLPHHGVYHPRKPGKLRVVFDCSARYGGRALNDALLIGPDFLNSLVGILCRFRCRRIAVSCDIERMFYRFSVNPEHRDYLRFLWWTDADTTQPPTDYRMTVHVFGAASSPGCANFGLRHLATVYEESFPAASEFIKTNFYVDDGLASVATEEEAIKLIKEAQTLCERGGLRLHKFNSNSDIVMQEIDPSERSGNSNAELRIGYSMDSVLGMKWNKDSDTLTFEIQPKGCPATRRGILSQVSSVYDPLGLVSPVILVGKSLLQQLCKRTLSWDDSIPEELIPHWERWLNGIESLNRLSLPRCFLPEGFGALAKIEMHHFADASTVGYGACSYIRLQSQQGRVHCQLVMAKARVSPMRIVSIPRLELTACLVLAKLSQFLTRELDMKVDDEVFWCDSQVALGYIRNDARRFHVFVANRVEQIRQATRPDQWHYVRSSDNPADHASRGMQAEQLLSSSTWFSGPSFLWDPDWKLPSEAEIKLNPSDPEIKKTKITHLVCQEGSDLHSRLERFSSWDKMTSAFTVLIRRAAGNQLSKAQSRERATQLIIRLVQRESFQQELNQMRKKSQVDSKSTLVSLDPFMDNTGILRVGGRLKKSSAMNNENHPIILPKNSSVTKVIIRHIHEKIQHQGRGQTSHHIRSNGYWIVKGSRLVASVIRSCVACRRLHRNTETQQMSDLPPVRIEPSPPFTHIGMDCFGPFYAQRGRSEVKRYGLIITCLASRAIHLELLEDMSTNSLINALRCFLSVRGPIKTAGCDQGSNFVGARNDLRSALKEMSPSALETYLAKHHIEFIFNAPHSSEAGGVWERQIRTVRNVLCTTIGLAKGRFSDSQLRTLLYEAMYIVNSRPLSPMDVSDPCAEESLSPNQLLTMKKGTELNVPPGRFERSDVYARKSWRRIQFLADQFWCRWRREYLLNLQERKKWQKSQRNLREGDIVLVRDLEAPRAQWPLARVTSTRADDDELVRRVTVQVGNRFLDSKGCPLKKASILERPVRQIVLLIASD